MSDGLFCNWNDTVRAAVLNTVAQLNIQAELWKGFVNYKLLTTILLLVYKVGPGTDVVAAEFNKEIFVIIYSWDERTAGKHQHILSSDEIAMMLRASSRL